MHCCGGVIQTYESSIYISHISSDELTDLTDNPALDGALDFLKTTARRVFRLSPLNAVLQSVIIIGGYKTKGYPKLNGLLQEIWNGKNRSFVVDDQLLQFM